MVIDARSVLWLLVGVGVACLHMLLLGRAVEGLAQVEARHAARRVMMGLPLRLLVVAPFLLMAARQGAIACGALMLGWLIARWFACCLVLRHQRLGNTLSRQG